MSVLLKENPVKKQELVINLAASGKSNKEIAEELGYKDVGNLYTFMRRRGLIWNTNKGLYIVKGEKEEPEEVVEEIPVGKVGNIISMFDKKMDGKEISKSLRFGSYQEMADYMKSKGYVWDNKRGNYKKAAIQIESKPVKEEQPEAPQANNNGFEEEYSDILKLLKANKGKLTQMFRVDGEETANIPRYKLPGINTLKTLNITNTVERLIKDFSEDKSISQKEIVEIAVIEFLKKYGFTEQVKAVLHV